MYGWAELYTNTFVNCTTLCFGVCVGGGVSVCVCVFVRVCVCVCVCKVAY